MIERAKQVLIDVMTHFNADDGWAMASHVALSIMLALFPFLIFATSLAGFLGIESQADEMVDLVFETWPEQVARPIAREIDTVLTKRHTGFLTLGIALALFFASNGVEAVRVAMNRAYRVREDRSFVLCRMQSLLFVVLGAMVLLLVSFLLVVVPLLSSYAYTALPVLKEYEAPLVYLRYGGGGAAMVFAVFACHAWLPAGKRPMLELWPGILVTLLIWLAAAELFAGYLESFADYSSTFAGLAGVMTAQVFLYLMAVILILGGELNAALWEYRRMRRAAPPTD